MWGSLHNGNMEMRFWRKYDAAESGRSVERPTAALTVTLTALIVLVCAGFALDGLPASLVVGIAAGVATASVIEALRYARGGLPRRR